MNPKTRRVSNPNNKAEASVARRSIERKTEVLEQAVEWCKNNKRGHSAVKAGLFSLVKNERTVNK